MNKEDLKQLYSNIITITWILFISIPFEVSLFIFLMSGSASFLDSYISNGDLELALAVMCFIPVFAVMAAVCFLPWAIFVAIIAFALKSIKKDIPFKDAFRKVYKWSVWITYPLILLATMIKSF